MILGLTVAILSVSLCAVVAGSTARDTVYASPEDTFPQNISISPSVSADTETDNSSFVIPDAYLRGEMVHYTDSARINDIKVTVPRETGKFVSTVEYIDDATKNPVRMTANPGNLYYHVLVVYYHAGLREEQQSGIITTPSPVFHTLTDSQGNAYRSLDLNPQNGETSIGLLYTSTSLDRRDEYSGHLIFEVPENFTREGAYLTIKLGRWGKPSWKLWDEDVSSELFP